MISCLLLHESLHFGKLLTSDQSCEHLLFQGLVVDRVATFERDHVLPTFDHLFKKDVLSLLNELHESCMLPPRSKHFSLLYLDLALKWSTQSGWKVSELLEGISCL